MGRRDANIGEKFTLLIGILLGNVHVFTIPFNSDKEFGKESHIISFLSPSLFGISIGNLGDFEIRPF